MPDAGYCVVDSGPVKASDITKLTLSFKEEGLSFGMCVYIIASWPRIGIELACGDTHSNHFDMSWEKNGWQ